MTARTLSLPPLDFEALRERIKLRPVEGWLTVLATALLPFVLGASLVDAGWTTDAATAGGFYPWIGFAGLAFGLAGAKLGWGRWRTHIVGALFAGLFLVLIMGGTPPDATHGWDPHSLSLRMARSWEIVRNVWVDLVVQNEVFTPEYAHYHLVFGGLVWGAGQLAGYTVFGHRRPLDAVVVVGLAVLASMAVTRNPQLQLMVLFSGAALVLLIRTHVFDEEATWARRRIGEPGAVGQLYLRGGVAFITLAIVGSTLLTLTASSAPLHGLWQDLPRHLQGLAQVIQKFAPNDGNPRSPGGITFTPNAVTSGIWTPSGAIAFRADVAGPDVPAFKWRAGTYSTYSGSGWGWGTTAEHGTLARGILLNGFADEPSADGRRDVRIQITPDAYRDTTIIGPNTIQSVDRATKVRVAGDGGYYVTVETAEELGPYSILAKVRVGKDSEGAITQSELRTAGTDYPDDVVEIYTALPPQAVGPAAQALLDDIRAAVVVPDGMDPENPYDLARTMEAWLLDDAHFDYDANVIEERGQRCDGISTAECFAIIKRGYCEYYATTMAVLLREAGVPARIAYGFLGSDKRPGGVEIVNGGASHWWVEAYFPGYGWIEFDPTGGGIGQPVVLPTGSAVAPDSTATRRPATPRPTSTGATQTQGPNDLGPGGATGAGPFIAITVILAVIMVALALAALRRTPRNPMHPDQAWGSVARLAARLGIGPRASQTVYEFAGALGDEVPAARVELTTLARAKVEVAYGRRALERDRLTRIAQAYQRLRFALLSVALRRGLRRGRRR